MNYHLDDPIMEFVDDNCLPWTYRNAFEAVGIFGSLGSGKSSGSGRTLALKYLKKQFGGCVLTCKPDEAAMWQEYCALTGRLDDLIIIEPGGKYSFDFLGFLSKGDKGDALTTNIVHTLKTVIRASAEKTSGTSDDPFWENSLSQLLENVIDLCFLAYGKTSVQLMYDIVQSLPTLDDSEAQKEKTKKGAFYTAYQIPKTAIAQKIKNWREQLHWAELDRINAEGTYEDEIEKIAPGYKTLKLLDQYFFYTFRNLSTKTRSIVELNFSGFLYGLLREPVHSLFCKKGKIDVNPNMCLEGKVIVVNLNVKEYREVGRSCQILFKYLFQIQMEKRNVQLNDRPCFLFADEAYNFSHSYDADFQSTARSSRVATVYIAQNLHQYFAFMGGDKARERVQAFLGTLGTKIAHANSDVDSNKFISELIGDALFYDTSTGTTVSDNPARSQNVSLKYERQVRPEDIVGLATGGKRNHYEVEAYIHVQGDQLFNNQNFKKITFNQNYK